jgi:hypothetical protein
MGLTGSSPSLLSQSTAFGPLSDHTSRRTFAYLIATLNASHPHYDFSNVLRPADFKREKNLRRIMANLDSILANVRGSTHASHSTHHMGGSALGGGSMDGAAAPAVTETVWGPKCWALIDKEMHLDDCTMFSYQPETDPFEEDESAIWSAHYFFFNRSCKRVAYLYVRVVPVMSSQSPTVSPSPYATGRRRRGESDHEAGGATKRARFWLGDRDGEVVESYDDDEDDDGFVWNRGEDGDLVVPNSDDDYADEYEAEAMEEEVGEEEEDEDEDEDEEESYRARSLPRGVSEDIASQMEI